MKTEVLQQAGLTTEQIAVVMKENGLDIAAEQVKTQEQINLVTSLTTERDTYKQQVEDAAKEIKGYKELDIEGIKTAATTWETKYNTDIEALQTQLKQQSYERELEKFVDGYQFTSELAKKAVVMELKAKEFKLENGVLFGAKEFIEQLKTANPTAFSDDKKPPTITLPGTNTPPAGVTKEDFKKMSYAERMKIFTENKDLYNQLSK